MNLYLQNIQLSNFKNYEEIRLEFSEEMNCILGKNGSGKTNLLDAVYYLSMSKSAFNTIDSQNILHQAQYFTIQGDFALDGKNEKVFCGVQMGEKKIFKLNQYHYEKISDHIGKFPVVLIAPQDQMLIHEGSEERRKFFDSIFSQLDNQYLLDLIRYNHLLKQRNSLLKLFAEKNYYDKDLLSTYDVGILQIGWQIFQKRTSFIRIFVPLFQENYKQISDNQEDTNLVYESDLSVENFETQYYQNLSKDLALQRTTLGIHKDDFNFELEGYPLKKYGSQGQQKSFLIALKMAHFQIIYQQKNIKPILLLDDIFDKLDDIRIEQLMRMVADNTFGQIFITDARPERTAQILHSLSVNKKMITISNGKVMD